MKCHLLSLHTLDSDSSPHLGGVQSFCIKKGKIYLVEEMWLESFRFQPTLILLFLKQIEFYYKFIVYSSLHCIL